MSFAARGWKYRLLIRVGEYASLDPSWTVSGAKIFYPAACTMDEGVNHVLVPGTRGVRALFPDQTVRGNRVAGGAIRVKFGRLELDYLLPLILGAAESSDVFKVADTVPWFQLLVDKGQGDFFEYRDCKVGRATFSGSTGGLINLDLEIACKKQEVYAAAWPSGAGIVGFGTTVGARALRFCEGSMRMDYGATNVELHHESFALSIDNMLDVQWYAGDCAATAIDEDRRSVMLGLPAAYTAAVKGYWNKGFELISGKMEWPAPEGMLTKVEFPKLAWPQQGPTMAGEGRTPLPLNMVAYRTEAGDGGLDDEVKFTNDPVPT